MEIFKQTWDKLAVIWRTEPDDRQHLFDVLNAGQPHRSFVTENHLRTWLRDLNLIITELRKGEPVRVIGKYHTIMHSDIETFNETQIVHITRALSYNEFTLGLISEDENNIRTLHMMAPLTFGRIVFDSRLSKELVG